MLATLAAHVYLQCCDRCMEFAEGSAVQELEEQGIVAYVWCSGCDTDFVNSLLGGPPFPFHHQKSRYSNRTEGKADANVSVWVDANVCSKLIHKCETTSATATTTTHRRKLSYKAATTTTSTTSSTTTTILCHDICELLELYGLHGIGGRLWHWRELSNLGTSFCERDQAGLINLTDFFKPLDNLQLISFVTLSGFTPSALRASSTLSAVQAACAAGFAIALGVQPSDLVVVVEINETTHTAPVSAFVTEAIALRCDLRFPVEIAIEAMLKSPPFYPDTGYHADLLVWPNGTYAATASNTEEGADSGLAMADLGTTSHGEWSAIIVAIVVSLS